MDRLTALRVFRQVVELGSFAEASRRLGLSPAAISKNISELEAHLAVRLLNRTTRRMSLTEAGASYYQQVARILDDLTEADRSLGPMQSVPRGVLRVTAPLTVTILFLSSAIPKFLSRYPELSLELQLDDRRVDIVKEGYDLAIRGSDNFEDSSLISRKLLTLQNVVCGSPSYFDRCGVPRTPRDLLGHTCIQFMLSGHAHEWGFRKADQSVSIPIDGRYKVTSSLAVLDALRAGFGVSLIPLQYVRAEIEAGTLRTALDDWTGVATTIHAVYPSRQHLSSKLRVFLDFLFDELGRRELQV